MGTDYPQTLDCRKIARLVPHNAPWQLIDCVESWNERSIVVKKAISGADPMMAAHLADGPGIMPGVLHIELIAQAITLLNILNERITGKDVAPVMGRCKGEFLSPAYIGETLRAEATLLDLIAGKTIYEGVIHVDERLICKVSGMGALLGAHFKINPF